MKRIWLIVAGVLVGLTVLVVATDAVISSPSTCMSCHEMQHRGNSWKRSGHAEIKCVTCHVQPHAWYAYPIAFFDRAKLVSRDLALHARGGYPDPVDARPQGIKPMQDEICLQCHSPNRKATSGYRILIDHAAHAKRNGSCVSCHVRTAHPLDDRSAPMSLMSQCFTCHGTPKYPKASRACNVCHPDTYDLRPESHVKAAAWKKKHGKVAAADRKQCTMCHEKSFCADKCHGGLEMPHPAGWEKGATGHAVVAKTNRAVCTSCHGSGPNMCTMCHHKAFDPTKGPWVKQHYRQVRVEGSAFCMKCHDPLFCVRCHATVGQPGGPAPTQ